jgi:hemolysin activation/secretion protein
VLRLPLPRLSKGEYDGTLSIAPFFDIGWGEDIDNPSSDTDVIYSLGLGLRWDISRKIHAYLYYGHGFEPVENISRNLQDEGIHFEVRCEFF